jgi:hypothetical protein
MAPSIKKLQTAPRNTFFRMRRDDSILKNSCQAKNTLLQSSQYGHSMRIYEPFQFSNKPCSEIAQEHRKLTASYSVWTCFIGCGRYHPNGGNTSCDLSVTHSPFSLNGREISPHACCADSCGMKLQYSRGNNIIWH